MRRSQTLSTLICCSSQLWSKCKQETKSSDKQGFRQTIFYLQKKEQKLLLFNQIKMFGSGALWAYWIRAWRNEWIFEAEDKHFLSRCWTCSQTAPIEPEVLRQTEQQLLISASSFISSLLPRSPTAHRGGSGSRSQNRRRDRSRRKWNQESHKVWILSEHLLVGSAGAKQTRCVEASSELLHITSEAGTKKPRPQARQNHRPRTRENNQQIHRELGFHPSWLRTLGWYLWPWSDRQRILPPAVCGGPQGSILSPLPFSL